MKPNPTHSLLLRQLGKLGLDAQTAPDAATWQTFLNKVDETYKEEDQSRYLLERSLALSSEEMQQLYQDLRDYSEQLSEEKNKLEQWSKFRSRLLTAMTEILRGGFDQHFYQRLLDHAVQTMSGADAGSLLLKDETGTFRFVAAHHFDLAELQKVTFTQEELLPQEHVTHNIAEHSRKVLDKERLSILERASRLSELRSTLPLPITFEGEAIGMLFLDSRQREAFDDDTTEMGKVFVAQAGVLLQRFKLAAELERTNLELARLANYDPLTTLPNRALFKQQLKETLLKNKPTALLFIDLDGFKLINDSLGHAAGDLLLKEVAQRLKGCVRKSDMVARLAGDEFTIILEGLEPEHTLVIAEKVLAAIGRAYFLHGHEFFISASMGIAHSPHHASESDALIKLADTAMYYAKSLGKNQYHVFTEDMNRSVAERMRLVQALRRGLERHEFFLHYQPRIQLTSGQVISVEALLRWQHPEQGFISPAVFIPLAEDTGIIHSLGDMVLEEACRQAMNWYKQGHQLRVAVNVSVKQLQQEDFVEKTCKVLTETGLPAHLLELEITESAAMSNVESNIAKLSRLKEHGIYISIDDFGTAYSSLNYLKRLPVHSLKIDKSFVQDLSDDVTKNPANAAIVRSIVALGKNMDLQLVAEGVETAGQLDFLNDVGCDEAQGYYFSKPVLPKDLVSYLNTQPRRLENEVEPPAL